MFFSKSKFKTSLSTILNIPQFHEHIKLAVIILLFGMRWHRWERQQIYEGRPLLKN